MELSRCAVRVFARAQSKAKVFMRINRLKPRPSMSPQYRITHGPIVEPAKCRSGQEAAKARPSIAQPFPDQSLLNAEYANPPLAVLYPRTKFDEILLRSVADLFPSR